MRRGAILDVTSSALQSARSADVICRCAEADNEKAEEAEHLYAAPAPGMESTKCDRCGKYSKWTAMRLVSKQQMTWRWHPNFAWGFSVV